jgi:hypothetical protein
MTTNGQGADIGTSRGAQLRLKTVGKIAVIILATWVTAAPALANNFDSRHTANKTASMTRRLHVADLGSGSCRYVMPLILGIGF